MNVYECDGVIAKITPYADKFDSFKVGKQLLASDGDYKEEASMLVEKTKDKNAEDTAIVFIGQGT